ncbi:YheU family protein [Flocculibacter collagenilyticus]|uniref:YheU family protein n=1 Tax=Flocculibacter collagenilyticus TaxID=2744479 RepID=UPI0018F649B2|nr:YheU family protein [Flocculibacter collagenilyticus]
MLIPHDQLSPDTLANLIKEYVLREGTDYGFNEVTLEAKIAQIKQQLVLGDIVIVFSQAHETVNLISKDAFNKLQYQEASDDYFP